jgi:predicted AlkP superfamily pyrophosphatase or phosphodiesterase
MMACTPKAETARDVSAARKEPAGPIHHVVVVTLDGMLPDSYMHPDDHGLKIPTLRWMKDHGAFSDGALSVFPTVTYPSHTSMVTGVVPGKHGIVANLAFDPLEHDQNGWRWYAEDIKRDPIWRLTENAGYKTALVHWPVSVGARVSFLVPEYWRAKDDQDQKLLRALSTPGLLESVAREHSDFWPRYSPEAHDDALTDIAVHLIEHEKPTLMMVHLVEVDGAQHHAGVWSPEAIAAIENDDRQLGRIFDAIRRSGIANDTSVIVASDHGFMNTGTRVLPGVLLREAGLVKTDEAGHVYEWKATVVTNSGQAYVYIHDGEDAKVRDAVREIFTAKTRDATSGIGRVYESNEIVALGGDPAAFLAIEAKPGFQFAPGCTGNYVAIGGYKGTHGYDPNRPEMRASMLLIGPNVPHGTIPNARLVDIAPTIAEWIGVEMKDVDGHAIRVIATP